MRRSEMIQIRVFPHELTTIKQNASVNGFEFVSDYVRSVAVGNMNAPKSQ